MSLIDFYDIASVEELRKRRGIDPEHIRKLRTAMCKHFREDQFVQQLSPLCGDLRLHSLELEQKIDSSLDGATKLLMRTARGMLIETVVLRIDSGRTTLCVSSQVGCAAACDFCATGRMGVAQNLSAFEIVDQIVLAGQELTKEERRLRNIVFMGMGEPFHNEAQLFAALHLLTSPAMFCHPASRILVSSVGVADAMARCAEAFPQVNQALSLHSVEQSVRESIIPLAKKYPLEELHQTIRAINSIQDCPFMIEYLMLEDLNDQVSHAELLVDWLDSLNVHVNLIPYNPIDAAPNLRGTTKEAIANFAAILKTAGVPTTTRYSLGKDIAAACGQLVQRENRRIAQSLAVISEN